jgi:hypothetical protein
MDQGQYEDVKMSNHREDQTSWKDSTFKNVMRKKIRHVNGTCHFTKDAYKSAFNIYITPLCDGVRGPTYEVRPDASFTMDSIHSYDFLDVDAQPSSYFSRIFPFSQHDDIFEVMTHIMIDGTLFVRHARKGYVRTPVLKKCHSF